ncbi:hypothetical protein Tco_0071752 [Tanacetum coccineum]
MRIRVGSSVDRGWVDLCCGSWQERLAGIVCCVSVVVELLAGGWDLVRCGRLVCVVCGVLWWSSADGEDGVGLGGVIGGWVGF